MVEMSLNMKSFCNNYYQMYYSGNFMQALRLIRTKALVTSINFQVPIPSIKNHRLEFQAMTQTDLKKSLGISHWKIGHAFDYDASTSYRVRILISLKLFVQTSYNAKEGMGVLNWEVNRKFLKGLLALKFRASISKNGISPGISF